MVAYGRFAYGAVARCAAPRCDRRPRAEVSRFRRAEQCQRPPGGRPGGRKRRRVRRCPHGHAVSGSRPRRGGSLGPRGRAGSGRRRLSGRTSPAVQAMVRLLSGLRHRDLSRHPMFEESRAPAGSMNHKNPNFPAGFGSLSTRRNRSSRHRRALGPTHEWTLPHCALWPPPHQVVYGSRTRQPWQL